MIATFEFMPEISSFTQWWHKDRLAAVNEAAKGSDIIALHEAILALEAAFPDKKGQHIISCKFSKDETLTYTQEIFLNYYGLEKPGSKFRTVGDYPTNREEALALVAAIESLERNCDVSNANVVRIELQLDSQTLNFSYDRDKFMQNLALIICHAKSQENFSKKLQLGLVILSSQSYLAEKDVLRGRLSKYSYMFYFHTISPIFHFLFNQMNPEDGEEISAQIIRQPLSYLVLFCCCMDELSIQYQRNHYFPRLAYEGMVENFFNSHPKYIVSSSGEMPFFGVLNNDLAALGDFEKFARNFVQFHKAKFSEKMPKWLWLEKIIKEYEQEFSIAAVPFLTHAKELLQTRPVYLSARQVKMAFEKIRLNHTLPVSSDPIIKEAISDVAFSLFGTARGWFLKYLEENHPYKYTDDDVLFLEQLGDAFEAYEIEAWLKLLKEHDANTPENQKLIFQMKPFIQHFIEYYHQHNNIFTRKHFELFVSHLKRFKYEYDAAAESFGGYGDNLFKIVAALTKVEESSEKNNLLGSISSLKINASQLWDNFCRHASAVHATSDELSAWIGKLMSVVVSQSAIVRLDMGEKRVVEILEEPFVLICNILSVSQNMIDVYGIVNEQATAAQIYQKLSIISQSVAFLLRFNAGYAAGSSLINNISKDRIQLLHDMNQAMFRSTRMPSHRLCSLFFIFLARNPADTAEERQRFRVWLECSFVYPSPPRRNQETGDLQAVLAPPAQMDIPITSLIYADVLYLKGMYDFREKTSWLDFIHQHILKLNNMTKYNFEKMNNRSRSVCQDQVQKPYYMLFWHNVVAENRFRLADTSERREKFLKKIDVAKVKIMTYSCAVKPQEYSNSLPTLLALFILESLAKARLLNPATPSAIIESCFVNDKWFVSVALWNLIEKDVENAPQYWYYKDIINDLGIEEMAKYCTVFTPRQGATLQAKPPVTVQTTPAYLHLINVDDSRKLVANNSQTNPRNARHGSLYL